MTQAQIKTVQCLSPAGLHRMAYKEWGDASNPKVLVCVHGVTRVADDFDRLAQALCNDYRVVCPDVAGRGRSDWLSNPQHYQLPQYVSDMVTLLARLNADTVHWVGTSMGGLIGMGLSALKGNPVKKLVLNDIGPTLNPAAIARIGDYIGQDVRFSTFDDAARYIRDISLPFGPHSEEEWRKLASDVLKQDEDGQWIRHYDMNISVPFKSVTPESAKQGEALMWMSYDAITCPTLLLRGADSDLVSKEVAIEMTRRGPKAGLVEFSGVGHAPTLMHDDQIAVIREFLSV
ncbi:alpha/beta fold hydrolase [Noviherbaspirillum sp. Root189]|uniref:alpha/beta fold hydrolase n=1 Tax=Noviherbaspirillum sp. Root189 TaxID=1736487 RepID=UPI00070FE349|nr:alpha/beta hydrolase [Noviherbaspirillum sp. Root189]KRB84550.1 alpha/beta hydrolase [Noviherbaspirillum sp. Root189]